MVAISRAIAIAEMRGPAAGLAALDVLQDDPPLTANQPYWAARTGALAEADRVYELAIGQEPGPAVRHYLQGQRERLKA